VSQQPDQILSEGQEYERSALTLFGESKHRNIDLRLIGSIAVRVRCHQYSKIISSARKYKDIDFYALGNERGKIKEMFLDLNFEIDRALQIALEEMRYSFFHKDSRLRIDVFFDELNFCHRLDLRNRLSVEQSPTIPLADLLLSKLQIVNLEAKDIEDICLLFLEHPIGDCDKDCINVGYISRLLADDWGFWFTVKQNLAKLDSDTKKRFQKDSNSYLRIQSQLATLDSRLLLETKAWRWIIRAKIGTRLKWYRTVEEGEIF